MKDRLTRWLVPLVGEGLLTSEGEFWRRQRRLAQPAFQRQQIEHYASVMVDHTERMLATWQDGQVRDPHQDLVRLTLGIVAKTLLNAELGNEASVVGQSLEIVMNYFMSPMRWFGIRERVPLPSTRRYRRAIEQIDSLVYGVIKLIYTEWVVRESMRLYPPAWAIAREALADCEIAGYHVLRGTQMYLPQWLVHHDARWFADPESFRPERWDNDLLKRLPRCAYFPFGDGPRICIGNHFAMMEAVLILATIASRFRLIVEPGQRLELLPSITLRPRNVLGMRLQARNQRAIATAMARYQPAGQQAGP
jgi:cytochrome P450